MNSFRFAQATAPRAGARPVAEIHPNYSSRIALLHVQPSEVQHLEPIEVEFIQNLLAHGDKLGHWATPILWFPGSTPVLRNVDIRRRIENWAERLGLYTPPHQTAVHLHSRLLDDAILSIARYLILCRIGPVGMGMSFDSPLDPTRLAYLAYEYLPAMAAISISKALQGEPAHTPSKANSISLFSRLIDSDFERENIPRHLCAGAMNEFRRMRRLDDKGLWNDLPPWRGSIERTTSVAGPAVPAAPPTKVDPHLPLPDDYVSEMGKKSHWIIANLAPGIIAALVGFLEIWRQAHKDKIRPKARNERCEKFLDGLAWRDGTGTEIKELPFSIDLNAQGQRKEGQASLQTWPPRKMSQVFGLARVLQAANVFVVGLSTAPRVSESITHKRNCIQPAVDGREYLIGKTFKLVDQLDGEYREWALPEFTAHAINTQISLVSLLERLPENSTLIDPDSLPAGDHLWGQVGGAKSVRSKPLPASGVNALLRSYAKCLGMTLNPGGQAIRSHRFRKTLARLLALAITSAPKVLQNVLGHKSIEMTIYYILSDKNLAAEVETVARELRVMRCETVVSEIVAAEDAFDILVNASGPAGATIDAMPLGGYGGPAAARVQQAIQVHKAGVHRRGRDWGAEDARELAVLLTMQGKTWQLVRPGVLCTKAIGQAGPCNKKRGSPEPSRCSSGCDFRLEEVWHRTEVDHCIAEAVKLFLEETERGEDLVAALWAGQVRANLPRFPDLQEKWLQHPTVRTIVALGATP